MKVKLFNNDINSVKNVDLTLQQLGGLLAMYEDGRPILDNEGFVEVRAFPPGREEFLRFAVINQGYVKEVK